MSSVCLFICLSVCHVGGSGVDHIGWKSWKLTARTISLANTFSLRRPKAIHLLPGDHGEILRRLDRRGTGISGVLEHKSGNISETRKDREVTIEGYRNSPTLFRTVYHPGPHTAASSPTLGFATPSKLQKLLFQERAKLQTSNLARTFARTIRTKAH